MIEYQCVLSFIYSTAVCIFITMQIKKQMEVLGYKLRNKSHFPYILNKEMEETEFLSLPPVIYYFIAWIPRSVVLIWWNIFQTEHWRIVQLTDIMHHVHIHKLRFLTDLDEHIIQNLFSAILLTWVLKKPKF